MAITEEARHRLFQKLEATIGPEEATILMEHLPPVGWADVATKRDLDHLASATTRDVEHLASTVTRELDHLHSRIRLDLELGLQSQLRWTLGYVTILVGLMNAALFAALELAR